MEPEKQRHVVDEVYGFIKVFSDGSVERPIFPGGLSPSNPTRFLRGVATRDVTIDPETNIWARIFLPKPVSPGDDDHGSRRKMPLVLHFHGGGLCSGSPDARAFHTFCSLMAAKSQTIWVSVDYRLAPEHRLPAAYDDAFTAFMWIRAQSTIQEQQLLQQQQNSRPVTVERQGDGDGDDVPELPLPPEKADPWLFHFADFSNLFLAGESSGGAIVHYLTMRILGQDIASLRVRGSLLIHGAFLIKGVFDDSAASFNPAMEFRPGTYRRLMLPDAASGSDDDAMNHPLIDPLHPQAPALNGIHLPPSIIAVAQLDKLCAPALHLANVLQQLGHVVDVHLTKDQGHCFYLRNPSLPESQHLFQHLATFIRSRCIEHESSL
jgi:acetyl esterase/lipase